MDRRTAWDDAELLLAVDRYDQELRNRGLAPATVRSEVYYVRLYLRWRTGDYMPCRMLLPTERPAPAGERDLAGLTRELGKYEAFLGSTCLQRGAVRNYEGPVRRFVRWLGGEDAPKKTRRGSVPAAGRRTAEVYARSAGLAKEFVRIRDDHPGAIVRTVARMALPGSVGRVFTTGTTKALVDLLPRLPVDQLRTLSDQADYRAWFEAALRRVAKKILEFNPREARGAVHPGYDWGHGTKVLSLFVRNLVLFSRYFTEDEARRLQWWLYCPVDRIVIERLRRVGFDPGVNLIREIDEAAFWRIQDGLSEAAATAGVQRVWFDDVWSETRD